MGGSTVHHNLGESCSPVNTKLKARIWLPVASWNFTHLPKLVSDRAVYPQVCFSLLNSRSWPQIISLWQAHILFPCILLLCFPVSSCFLTFLVLWLWFDKVAGWLNNRGRHALEYLYTTLHYYCFSYRYRPSGVPSFLRYRTFSLDFLKSSLVTFILLSLNAISPASVQIAC